ncbi:MAG TPA: TIGR04282 family arsenosugar biosynthesis glycosyltransferase [Methylomirabilota bacterium]|nr:TIGR04282 family arsenosugar biosynthesis glycosyltransferase [Methylomirabilota bacterium]
MRAPLAPALAVMAKVPGVGLVKSRLHSALTPDRATELYRCFLLDRLEAITGLPGVSPVVAFTPAEAEGLMRVLAPARCRLVPQRGADLGERLSALLAGLLEEGHPGAIAIDSDSPTLPMSYVSEAARLLGEGRPDVVLGPCEDGGYYLIGLRSPQPALFEGISWSTDAVLSATLAKARAAGLSVHLLPRWFDVDTEHDLRRLHAELAAGNGVAPRTAAFIRQLYGGVDRDPKS